MQRDQMSKVQTPSSQHFVWYLKDVKIAGFLKILDILWWPEFAEAPGALWDNLGGKQVLLISINYYTVF